MQPELRRAVDAELRKAENARMEGNEGRARVCARRAAGLAARSYLLRQGYKVQNTSAYQALKMLLDLSTHGSHIQEMVNHLTLVVNQDFNLPDEVDLIADAKSLIGELE
jgi:hypothetical protein